MDGQERKEGKGRKKRWCREEEEEVEESCSIIIGCPYTAGTKEGVGKELSVCVCVAVMRLSRCRSEG